MTLRFNKRLSITPITESGGGGGSAKGSFDKASQTLTLNNAYVIGLINQMSDELPVKQVMLETIGSNDLIYDFSQATTYPTTEMLYCPVNIEYQGNPLGFVLSMSGGSYTIIVAEGVLPLNTEGLNGMLGGGTIQDLINMGGVADENVFTITGTQGNYDVVFNEPKEYEKKFGADINCILGDVDANGALQAPTEQVDLVFTGVEDLGEKALAYKFYQNTVLKSISFPDLVAVSGNNALDSAFYGGSINGLIYDGLTSISLPKLETVSGYQAFNRAFQNNRGVTSVELPKLTTISGANAFSNAFDAMNSLTSVSFPALTSQSFGSNTNQFNRMLNSVTGCTVHFPSNLQNVIGSWSDVTNGFGGTNTVVLFDLPATE